MYNYLSRFIILSFLLPVLLHTNPVCCAEEYWNQFRGPQGTGTVEDHPALPDKWSATENVAWEQEIPGMGWSSPIVWGDKVFLTTVIKEVRSPKGLFDSAPHDEKHQWWYCA